MSKQINAGADVKRGDFFFVDPFSVIVKDENRGRAFPPTPQQIIDKAVSILDQGQIQPVVCRCVQDNKLLLNAGFTRCAAVRLIRTGFEYEGQRFHDPEFKLKVVLQKGNDLDALKTNIAENQHRDDTSVIDDAHNQNVLRDRHGLNDGDIAKIYRCTEDTVVKKAKLLGLSAELQKRVHYKGLSMGAALSLLELPDDQREAAVEAASGKNGHVDGTALAAMMRDRVLSDSENGTGSGSSGNDKKKSKTKGRSRGEIRKFAVALWEARDKTKSEGKKRFAETLLRWIDGKASDKALLEVIGG